MGTLPDAVPQMPACGACGGETRSDGEHFYCEYCLLGFAPITLIAFFLDPNAETCGAPCDNSWHGDHRIRQGWGYDCGSCGLLPVTNRCIGPTVNRSNWRQFPEVVRVE